MEKKCIIWARVSTVRQDLERQTKELQEKALSDGYKKQYILKAKGASAIKLSDLYIDEINSLVKMLKETEANAVYVWSVSRLARNERVFYTLKEMLIRHHIQLTCLNPPLSLLDSTGKVNNGTELALNLMMTLAKQEMDIKKERFRIGKLHSAEIGKISSGKPIFGYTVDSAGFLRVKEDEAKIVRLIFKKYTEEDISTQQLYKWMAERGYMKPLMTRQQMANRIRHILTTKCYAGLKDDKRVYQKTYPKIICEEMFSKALKKLKLMKCKAKTNHKHIGQGKGIIRHSTCGNKVMIYQHDKGSYVCPYCHKGISARVLNKVLWLEAVPMYYSLLTEDRDKTVKGIRDKQDDIDCQMTGIGKILTDIDKRKKRLNDIYLMDGMTKDEYERQLTKIRKERQDIKARLSSLQSERQEMNKILTENQNYHFTSIDDILGIKDMAKRYDIIHKVISSLDIVEDGDNGYTFNIRSTIWDKVPYTYKYQRRKRYVDRIGLFTRQKERIIINNDDI